MKAAREEDRSAALRPSAANSLKLGSLRLILKCTV